MLIDVFNDLGTYFQALLADPPRILEWDMLLRIALQCILFSVSAFFSGSETALFSLSRFDLQKLARAKDPAAPRLQTLIERPRELIVSILCGNELINIAAAANMTAIFVELVGVEAAAWIAGAVMVPLILLFGEVTPKSVAVSNPVWFSTRLVAGPLSRWAQISAPLTLIVRAIADRVTTLIIGPARAEASLLAVDEIRMLVEEGVETGEITPTERTLVHGLLSAGATDVRKIMTPRAELGFLNARTDRDIRASFLALKRARVPVYRGSRDFVVGFLYVEDVLKVAPGETLDLPALLHPPHAVPITKRIDEMLDFFEKKSARAALVVNEFGTIEGMVTLSDVTRFLFNGVFEDVALQTAEILPCEGGFDIEGRANLAEVRRATGIDIQDPVMTTIAGVVLRKMGSVPSVSDRAVFNGFELVVTEMENLRVTRIRMETKRTSKTQGGAA